MEISLLDLFAILKKCVQSYPKTDAKPCLQPQAFRVFQKERGTELNAANLGAVATDKDRPFFWSRIWQNAKYSPNDIQAGWPLVTAYEIYNDKANALVRDGKREYVVELAVLDTYKETDCAAGNVSCSGRPINQIFLDTEIILDTVLQYLGELVLATTSTDATAKLYSKSILELMLANGTIESYNEVYDIGAKLQASNKDMRFSRVERHAQSIYGTKCQIRFQTKKCITALWTLPDDIQAVGHEAGCVTC